MTDRRTVADDIAVTASVWDDVVGQPGRRRSAAAGRHRPGPRLPVRRSARIDEARGGPGVRRRGARRRRRPRRARRPPGPRRRAPRRARGRAHGPVHHEAAGRGHRPLGRAGAGRGRPQGPRPARVPPRPGRRRRRPAEDDRGAARLDDVPRARRLRAPAVDHDRLALRARSTSARSPTTCCTARLLAEGHRRRDRRRPSSPRPAATSPGLACSPGTRRSPTAGARSPSCRGASTARAATVMRLVEELLAQIDSAAAPLVERHAAEAAELDARIAQFGERGSGRKLLEERHKPGASPASHRRVAQRAGRPRRHVPRRPRRRRWPPPGGAGGRRRADPPRPSRRSASTTRTNRCCCNPCCGRSRPRQAGSVGVRSPASSTMGSSPRIRPTASSAASAMTARAMP